MKKLLVLLSLMGTFALINAQTLSIQDLFDLSKASSLSDFKKKMQEKGFVFNVSYGYPKIYSYQSGEKFRASSQEQMDIPNECLFSFTADTKQASITYRTVSSTQYDSLMNELKNDSLNFIAIEKKGHSFMDGIRTKFTSKLFPNMELTVTDVIANQYVVDGPKVSWKSYAFELLNINR